MCCCTELCQKCCDFNFSWFEIRDITDPWAHYGLLDQSSNQDGKDFVYAVSRVRIAPPEWEPEFSPVCMRIYCKSGKAIRKIARTMEMARLFKKASFLKEEHFWSAIIDADHLSKILKLEGVNYEITECCPYFVEHMILGANER